MHGTIERQGAHSIAAVGDRIGRIRTPGGVGVEIETTFVKQHTVLVSKLQIVLTYGNGGQVFASPECGRLDGGNIPANRDGVDPGAIGKSVLVDADDSIRFFTLHDSVGNDDITALTAGITGIIVDCGILAHRGRHRSVVQLEIDALNVAVIAVKCREIRRHIVPADGGIALPGGRRPSGGAAAVENGEVGGDVFKYTAYCCVSAKGGRGISLEYGNSQTCAPQKCTGTYIVHFAAEFYRL